MFLVDNCSNRIDSLMIERSFIYAHQTNQFHFEFSDILMRRLGNREIKEYRRSTWGEGHVGIFRSLDKLLSDATYLTEELPDTHKNTNDLHEYISDCLRAVRKDLIMFHNDRIDDVRYDDIVRMNFAFHIGALEWNLNVDSAHFNLRFLKESLRRVENRDMYNG